MLKMILENPQLQEVLAELVAALFLAAFTGAATFLIRWLRANGVNVSAAQEKRLLEIAPIAVQGVEEYVRQAQRKGMALESNEKLDLAVKMARELAVDGLKTYTDDKLKTALEAHLPGMRARLSLLPPPPPGLR